MTAQSVPYAARLQIDHPTTQLDRLSTFFRLIWAIPIMILATALTTISFFGTAVMILIRQRYPRWWFEYSRELTAFTMRVGAYLVLLTDRYPSTEEEQSVHFEMDFPDVRQDLNRWLPLVKWFLAIPHYVVLFFLWIVAFFAVLVAWFAILFTGRYPQALFDYVVGVMRWTVRVTAYAFLLVTDRYPPFSLA